MRTADKVHVVLLQESRDNVRAECERDTSVVFTPAGDVLVGIGPQQIAEQSAVGNLWQSVNCLRIALRSGLRGNVRQWVS